MTSTTTVNFGGGESSPGPPAPSSVLFQVRSWRAVAFSAGGDGGRDLPASQADLKYPKLLGDSACLSS
jgi:hypothetical protein